MESIPSNHTRAMRSTSSRQAQVNTFVAIPDNPSAQVTFSSPLPEVFIGLKLFGRSDAVGLFYGPEGGESTENKDG